MQNESILDEIAFLATCKARDYKISYDISLDPESAMAEHFGSFAESQFWAFTGIIHVYYDFLFQCKKDVVKELNKLAEKLATEIGEDSKTTEHVERLSALYKASVEANK